MALRSMFTEETHELELHIDDIIFGCQVCQATVREVYGEQREQHPLSTRFWVAECTHVFCGKHLEGGAAPFHPQNRQPRAACPICRREVELYGIRSLQEGGYDKAIPATFLQCPPLPLDSDGPGTEAMRFQYTHIALFAQQVAKKWKSEQRKRCALEKDVHRQREHWRKQDFETKSRIRNLEKAEKKLQKWEERREMINHYLGVVNEMGQDLRRMRTHLVELGLQVPEKSYAFKAKHQPPRTARQALSHPADRERSSTTLVESQPSRDIGSSTHVVPAKQDYSSSSRKRKSSAHDDQVDDAEAGSYRYAAAGQQQRDEQSETCFGDSGHRTATQEYCELQSARELQPERTYSEHLLRISPTPRRHVQPSSVQPQRMQPPPPPTLQSGLHIYRQQSQAPPAHDRIAQKSIQSGTFSGRRQLPMHAQSPIMQHQSTLPVRARQAKPATQDRQQWSRIVEPDPGSFSTYTQPVKQVPPSPYGLLAKPLRRPGHPHMYTGAPQKESFLHDLVATPAQRPLSSINHLRSLNDVAVLNSDRNGQYKFGPYQQPGSHDNHLTTPKPTTQFQLNTLSDLQPRSIDPLTTYAASPFFKEPPKPFQPATVHRSHAHETHIRSGFATPSHDSTYGSHRATSRTTGLAPAAPGRHGLRSRSAALLNSQSGQYKHSAVPYSEPVFVAEVQSTSRINFERQPRPPSAIGPCAPVRPFSSVYRSRMTLPPSSRTAPGGTQDPQLSHIQGARGAVVPHPIFARQSLLARTPSRDLFSAAGSRQGHLR